MNFSEFSELNLNGKVDPLFNRVDGIEVKLTQEIVDKAKRIAKIRKENHKNHNKSDFNDKADFIGLFGECIFANKYNLEVDWEIKLRDEVDFIIGNDLIDVKSTEHSPYLSVKSNRLHNEYIYVFCVCRTKFNNGKIVGWLRGADVLKLGSEVTNVEEPYWRVPFPKLNSILIANFSIL